MIQWFRAWLYRRGKAACARGDHKWQRVPPQISHLRGMAALVEISVMYHYNWHKCMRCGVVGKTVRDL